MQKKKGESYKRACAVLYQGISDIIKKNPELVASMPESFQQAVSVLPEHQKKELLFYMAENGFPVECFL